MSELRLVPAAVLVWAVSLYIILDQECLGLVVAVCLVLGSLSLREWGQAGLLSALGLAATIVATVRKRSALAFDPEGEFIARVATAPSEVSSGGWLVRVNIDDYPAEVPVFSEEVPAGLVTGAEVAIAGRIGESQRAGIGAFSVNGDITVVEGPRGFDAFAAHVRQEFALSVQTHVPEHSQGLIPGMVLGDTSLQSASESDVYIVSGLSHLSAVSGANVAILVTAVVILARFLKAGLYTQIVAAGLSIVVFAGVVGAEPSVLRATLTGLVGLVAVLASSRSEPMHALCLAVIALVLINTDLAVNFGFALSVAATIGIVALYPFFYRALAPTNWPDILVRALSVAIAADIMTMPIVALMAGRVSLVSVVANVLVAPATAPVTVLGLIAAVLAVLPGGGEVLFFPFIQPFTWWIYKVGHIAADVPNAAVEAAPLTVLVVYGWVVAGFLYRRAGVTLAVVLVVIVSGAVLGERHAPSAPVGEMVAHVVDKREDIEPVPAGTEVIVVLDSAGAPAERGSRTAGGIPVLFPHRDGEVTVHLDGTQHAADGRF